MSTLYVSDLDGTLLNHTAALSDFSRTTLAGLLSEGLPFTVASARSVVSMQTILIGLSLSLPVIEFNGAFISDLKSGRHEVINAMEPEVVEAVCGLILKAGCAPFISSFNGSEDCAYYGEVLNEGMQWYLNDRRANRDKRLRPLERLTDAFKDQVVCLTVIEQIEVLLDLRRAIEGAWTGRVEMHIIENQYAPGWHWLTVSDVRACKGQAIQSLLEICGLEDREIVVFGDHANDVGMFRMADRALAVSNAQEVLKPYATDRIGSNEEDSVVRFIQEDWKRG